MHMHMCMCMGMHIYMCMHMMCMCMCTCMHTRRQPTLILTRNPIRTSTLASNAQVLKTTVLTVWDRNLQLAFYSMLIYGPRASHGQAGPSAKPPLGVARPLLWQCLPPTKEPSGHCQAAWSRRARP